MRTVYSVPVDRQYLRSGYPSEPILAEAAARQLHDWRRLSVGLDRDEPAIQTIHELRETATIEPALEILRMNLDRDLLSRGDIGEVVARLLLILARDHATCATYAADSLPNFSSPVPVNTFISHLLSEGFANDVLSSQPANLRAVAKDGQKTFQEAFANAVVNFTHFANWVDDSALDDKAALGCFMRGMAVMCRHNSSTVDAYIPVVMDKSARLDPSVMSVLLVQFKPRAQAGTMAINGFFSKPTGAGETQPRPYVTLIMDLDVTEKDPLLEKTPTRTTQHVEASARQRATENVHPRYSVYVHGCSPTAYRVIGAGERSIYQNILRRGQLIGEHPRQDATSLRQVRMQKPFFAAGPMSWHWLHNAWLNRGENDAHKKGPDPEGGVVFEDGHSLSNHSNE